MDKNKQILLNTLNNIDATKIVEELHKNQDVDSKAGIIIVKLTDIKPIVINGQSYDFYAARVLASTPEKSNYVNPHYHLHGEEPYRFIRGEKGEMNTGIVDNGKVIWNQPLSVKPMDVYSVKEGEVHSFRNVSTKDYDFVFACPQSHLSEEDRYFTKELIDGIPSWY